DQRSLGAQRPTACPVPAVGRQYVHRRLRQLVSGRTRGARTDSRADFLPPVRAFPHYSVFDSLATTGALITLSVPTFWFGLMVIFVFAEQLGWIPSGGTRSLGSGGGGVLDQAHHLVAPAMVLGLVLTAQWSRYFRTSLLETKNQEYVRTAHAKGLATSGVLRYHILRNAILPLIALA